MLKPLFVADVADNFTYMFYKVGLFPALTILSTFVPTLLAPISFSFLEWMANRISELTYRGPFNRRRMGHLSQWFNVDPEDARRVFVADALFKVAKELNESVPQNESADIGSNPPQIVLIYPKAHTMRIANYLLHPHILKHMFYSIFPGLDRHLREWRFDQNEYDRLVDARRAHEADEKAWTRVRRSSIPVQ